MDAIDITVGGTVQVPKDATTAQIEAAIDKARDAIRTLVYETLRKKGWRV
jgi:hypothetical protein